MFTLCNNLESDMAHLSKIGELTDELVNIITGLSSQVVPVEAPPLAKLITVIARRPTVRTITNFRPADLQT